MKQVEVVVTAAAKTTYRFGNNFYSIKVKSATLIRNAFEAAQVGRDFRRNSDVKSGTADAKGRSYEKAVKDFVKQVKAKEFYCGPIQDTDWYHDDCFTIYYR